MSVESWVRRASGLFVPQPGFANLAGQMQPCPGGDCCECGSRFCNNCNSDIADSYRVTFFGITNNGCSDCGDMNDPVSFICTPFPVAVDGCFFRYVMGAGDPCSFIRVDLQFDELDGGPPNFQIHVILTETTSGFNRSHRFTLDFDDLIPCCASSRVDWSSDVLSPTECVASTAYCIVEPV